MQVVFNTTVPFYGATPFCEEHHSFRSCLKITILLNSAEERPWLAAH